MLPSICLTEVNPSAKNPSKQSIKIINPTLHNSRQKMSEAEFNPEFAVAICCGL